ncbi:MAG TPA: acetylglutamate kinase [Planctomycetota bacterium]|nr:acetylglutamate kinase [Planctomycetota bacterium]
MMDKAIEKAAVLIEALPYIKSFHQKIIVVKLGGSAMTDAKVLHSVVHDVCFMEQVGMRPVLVHGGGPKITAAMEAAGLAPKFVDGQRYTDEPTLQIAMKALIDDLSNDVVRRIRSAGGVGIAVNGRDSDFLRGRKRAGKDLGLVGEVTDVNKPLAERLLAGDIIPVVAPIARGEDGTLYNVNADLAAARLAALLGASKCVFMSNVPGILRDVKDPDSLVSTVRAEDVRKLITDKVISGGMLPKVEAGLASIAAGVAKVHMISGLIPHSLLLEIFTTRGVGTEIVA